MNRTNEQKIDDSRTSILDLNEDCKLEIIKFIIADCEMRDKSQGNKMKYVDLVNCALADDNFETILEVYYKDLYKSLEFAFVVSREKVVIDFSELETTNTGKEGDVFWRFFANAISENNVLHEVVLEYRPESFQPDFLDHFEKIKRALENKKKLKLVRIRLNGYSLEDLNNFGNITDLNLDVRMSAEALVNVCKSNPGLISLIFVSTDILGRLSDIAPYCLNLEYLTFVPKPDIDGVEYAPLAELPNLQQITIFRAFENGSLLNIFEAITKWQRPGLQPLKITFYEFLPHLSNVNIARTNSILRLKLENHPAGVELRVTYDFWDISRDRSPIEQTLATITLIEAALIIEYDGVVLDIMTSSDANISGFISILKLFNIKTLKIRGEVDKIPIAKLFASIISDESYALKSIHTSYTKFDQYHTSELVKIKSITSLTCQLSDWKSVELLSELTNMETVDVKVEKAFEKNYSKALCNLLNTCSASGVIENPDWGIEFRKNDNIISQSKKIQTLKVERGSLEKSAQIFEAFSYRDLNTIEELDVSKCVGINIKDILQLVKVHPIKQLSISLAKTNDIETLSDLAELKELAIYDSVRGSLIKLLERLATKESPSIQCLKIKPDYLSSDELVQVSRISSLKKLDLCYFQPVDCESFMELANSNIEELILPGSSFSLRNLFSAFAAKTTTRLQHLKIREIPNRYLEICELEELSKIKSLKSLQRTCMQNGVSFFRNLKHLVKLDIGFCVADPEVLRCLLELEKLESLTLNLHKYSFEGNYDILADIQSLKKLNLSVPPCVNLTHVYQAFVSKNMKLTHLTTTIGCVEELNEITKIKPLRKLNLFIRSIGKKMTCLGELSELESLQIAAINLNNEDISNNVIPILKCCRNLDRLLIKSKFIRFCYSCLRDIYTHLKAIRDPTLQGPLTVIVTEIEEDKETWEEYNMPDILMTLFENVYMKVFTSSTLILWKY